MLKVLILASESICGSLTFDVFEAGSIGLLDVVSIPVTLLTMVAYPRETTAGFTMVREGPKSRDVERRAAIALASYSSIDYYEQVWSLQALRRPQ